MTRRVLTGETITLKCLPCDGEGTLKRQQYGRPTCPHCLGTGKVTRRVERRAEEGER